MTMCASFSCFSTDSCDSNEREMCWGSDVHDDELSLNSAHMFECRDGLAVNEIISIVIFTGGDGENHGRMAAFLCLLLAHFPRDR